MAVTEASASIQGMMGSDVPQYAKTAQPNEVTVPVIIYMRFQSWVASSIAPLMYVPRNPGMAPNVFMTPRKITIA